MTTQPLQKNMSAKRAAAFQQALSLLEQKKHADAKVAFEELLASDMNDAGSWCNLGNALRAMKHLDAGLAAAGRAVQLMPDDPVSLTNYGNCLTVLDRPDEALRALSKAARLAPGHFDIRLNYAIGLREFCRFEEALAEFDAAIALKPDHVNARWEKSIALLQLGRFTEAWKDYELRWKRGTLTEAKYKAPRWQGEDLKGKTILVYEEQGFGDTILSSRYIPLIKARGARVLLGCRKNLHRLFQTIQGVDRIVVPGKLGESFDYHIPLMSLPGIIGTTLTTIPPPPRLHVPATPPPEALRLLNAAKDRLRVGIVWSGNPAFVENRKRAVSAARFLPLASVPGVQLYSLQKGPQEKELATLGAEALIPRLGPYLNDFADTAAVLKHLDLVIMTDSAVAHVAGSIGCPVWNLLAYRPFWVYLHNRADSPWYSSMRFFRQQKPGDWDGVFATVVQELTTLVAATSTFKRTSADIVRM